MARIEFVWAGTSPLVMNNGRKADPDGDYAQASADIRGKRKKSPEDRQALARLEWEAGLYLDAEHGPVMPDQNVIATLIEGAKLNRNGKDVAALVSCEQLFVKLEYRGPRDPDGMWAAGMFDHRIVSSSGKPGGPKVVRYRPLFKAWTLRPIVLVDDELDAQTVVIAAKDAGRRVGLCERKRFRWGRFDVTEAKIT